LEGFYVVKAIVRAVVRPDRVVMRDAKAYCAILLDDNNRRPLVRLHFNGKSVKYITVFNEDKTAERIDIGSVDDIYTYADRLRATAASYADAMASSLAAEPRLSRLLPAA